MVIDNPTTSRQLDLVGIRWFTVLPLLEADGRLVSTVLSIAVDYLSVDVRVVHLLSHLLV
jgi:hypothetical protein